MEATKAVKELLNEAVDKYEAGCNPIHGSEMRGRFKRKGFDVVYISESFFVSKAYDVVLPICVLVFDVNEYAKLCTHCHSLVKLAVCGISTDARGSMVIAIAVIGSSILEFDDTLRSMCAYIDQLSDSANKQQIESQRTKVALDRANDTIKELRQELRAFRSIKKKEKKMNVIPPPEYKDERPPDF